MQRRNIKGYIYFDNLQSFEEYTLIDVEEEKWKMMSKIIGKEKYDGIRGIDSLYIKGTNKTTNYNNQILCKNFFRDYLELGKKLLELALTNHKIVFKINNTFDNSLELNNYYLQKKLWELDFDLLCNLNEEEKKNLEKIRKNLDIFSSFMKNFKSQNKKINKIIDLSNEIITSLLILNLDKEYNPIDELFILSDILESTINIVKTYFPKYLNNAIFDGVADNSYIEEILTMCDDDLSDLLESVNTTKDKLDFDLKKQVSLSKIKKLNSNNLTNIKISDKYKEPLFIVNFSYSQINELQDIIISWLKKYGFPYYVSRDEEKKYHIRASQIVPLKDNEELIPCNILITNCIFNYMYYTIYEQCETTDPRILDIFGFDSSKKFRENRSNIVNIKNDFDYYNNTVSSEVLGFRCSYLEDEYHEYNKNYFQFFDKKDDEIREKKFNNICIAINEIVKNETRKFFANRKLKFCSECGNSFIPTKEFRIYCSKKCQNSKDTKKKREQRKKEKEEKNY